MHQETSPPKINSRKNFHVLETCRRTPGMHCFCQIQKSSEITSSPFLYSLPFLFCHLAIWPELHRSQKWPDYRTADAAARRLGPGLGRRHGAAALASRRRSSSSSRAPACLPLDRLFLCCRFPISSSWPAARSPICPSVRRRHDHFFGKLLEISVALVSLNFDVVAV